MRAGIAAGLSLLLLSGGTRAGDVCPVLRGQQSAPEVASRIAAIACNENLLWYRPFIDSDGRMASSTVAEGETSRLGDGATVAWRRVLAYWRESGLLPQIAAVSGGGGCDGASGDPPGAAPGCRALVIDHPWSAAFVSWVMAKAGVPGFRASASHYDYVRDARLQPAASAYRFADPLATAPAVGDLLCYVRIAGRSYGFAGLAAAIDAGEGPLAMHCDIVAATNPGNDGKAWLVGGNVLQGVTLRELNINRNGLLWGLPRRGAVDPQCSPDAPSACNFNRQDWAVLLKLRRQDELAQLGPVAPPALARPLPGPQDACCVNCVLGAVPAIPRCPRPGTGNEALPGG